MAWRHPPSTVHCLNTLHLGRGTATDVSKTCEEMTISYLGGAYEVGEAILWLIIGQLDMTKFHMVLDLRTAIERQCLIRVN